MLILKMKNFYFLKIFLRFCTAENGSVGRNTIGHNLINCVKIIFKPNTCLARLEGSGLSSPLCTIGDRLQIRNSLTFFLVYFLCETGF